ncbi:hypothetical protein CMT52_16020 [Elizabethkingia anophelis]|nr:hypothetical protein [Elizabethkingia anophelis]MDV4025841.1 hypothetical protein [Elizabethkingia anophelis]
MRVKKNNAKVLLFQIVDIILYRLKADCQWQKLPTKYFNTRNILKKHIDIR